MISIEKLILFRSKSGPQIANLKGLAYKIHRKSLILEDSGGIFLISRMHAYLYILYINRRPSYDLAIHDVVHTKVCNQGGRTMLALYVSSS